MIQTPFASTFIREITKLYSENNRPTITINCIKGTEIFEYPVTIELIKEKNKDPYININTLKSLEKQDIQKRNHLQKQIYQLEQLKEKLLTAILK